MSTLYPYTGRTMTTDDRRPAGDDEGSGMTSAGAAPGAAADLPDWARRPANLASALTLELVQRIVAGQYPPGSAMPSEPVLCESYSVSRTVVREAVKMLQEKGLVQVRR